MILFTNVFIYWWMKVFITEKPFLMTKIIINKFKILLNAGFVKMV